MQDSFLVKSALWHPAVNDAVGITAGGIGYKRSRSMNVAHLYDGTSCVVQQYNALDLALAEQLQELGVGDLLAANWRQNLGKIGRVHEPLPGVQQLFQRQVLPVQDPGADRQCRKRQQGHPMCLQAYKINSPAIILTDNIGNGPAAG